MDKENKERKGRAEEVKGAFFPTPPAPTDMPVWYGEMLNNIKLLVANGRRQIMWTANVQMSMMYYQIGKDILQRQSAEGWGSKIVDRLSVDLKKAFPEMNGFSPRNLKYMRRFAEVWPDESIVQRCVAQLPWRHNICLMEKVKEPNRRLAYAMSAIEHGWSKTILEMQLDNYTLERTGKLPTNFDKTLPDVQSDMVQQMFKDPYLLDFTGADAKSREKDIEDGLANHITHFLLELGQGFSFVGRQVHLEMAGHDYYIDMLFYHLRLRCFVVLELKAVPFDPGMMGQLSFYQSVVDETLRHETDGKTIGLLLVKSKDETIVKYSLEGISKPIGVASWETELGNDIADKWKSALPTIEELEQELDKQLTTEADKQRTQTETL
jgi:predicted nuclease of restriction endonuclease-like (RecB) superfamily